MTTALVQAWRDRLQGPSTLPANSTPSVLTAPSGGRADKLALWAVAGAVAAVALLNPKLPGHSGPADVLMVGAILVVVVWAIARRAVWRLPCALGVTGYLATGLLASMTSAQPTQGLTAVLQEVFLFLWCAAVATVIRTPAELAVVLRAWAVSAVGWAALLVFAVSAHLHSIAGTGDRLLPGSSVLQTGGGFRSRLFFDHPNMAGNYYMIAVFILIASGYPRRLWVRVLCVLVLLSAMVVAGSNAALISIAGGGLLTAFLHVRVRAGLVKATAVVGVVAVLVGSVAAFVVPPVLDSAQQSSIRLIHDTLGRTNRSAAKRQSLFDSQIKLYREGNLVGIGPNGTQDVLSAQAAPEVKEAHNDYLGTLVERGPFGLLALFAIIAAVIARCVAFTCRPLPPRLAAAVPVPAALAGACLAFAITAFTHEVLHYRWLWTLFGLVAALHLLVRRETGTFASEAAKPQLQET